MEYTKHQHKKIEVCKKCNGFGFVITYAQNDYKEEFPLETNCGLCSGSGRVWVSKKIVTMVEAFKNNNENTEFQS